jgi:predicted MPP superfamily phosphohydrolase
MSLDWPLPVVLALALPPAAGHLYHFVLLINIGSGLGLRERLMDRIRDMLFVTLFVSAGWLLWMHTRAPWWTWSGPLRAYAVLCAVTGILVWPLNSALIAWRRRPAGIAGAYITRDLAGTQDNTRFVGTGRGSWLLRLPRNESFRLCLREWDLAIPALPGPLENLKIVQISDLHCAPCYDRRFFEAVVDECRAWSADLVFLTGDLVEHDETIAWIEPILSPLQARLGKFAILGNHDSDHQPELIADELARAGFTMLDGRWTTIESEASAIALGGTSAPWGPDIDLRAIPTADFRILLSHSPDRFYRAARSGIDLMFAGHNHGGQIRLPLIGPVFMPSVYSRRFDRGFFRRQGTLMYVSEGVGGMHPIRYGCPPEVSRFVLHAAEGAVKADRSLARDRQRAAAEPDWIPR